MGTGAKGALLQGMIQLPDCPCSALLAWALGMSGKGIWDGLDEVGASAFQEPWRLPSTRKEKLVGGAAWRTKILCGPPSINPTHPPGMGTGVGWKLLQQVRTPSFPWAGLKGRGLGKGQRRCLPTPHWLLFTPKR